MARLISEPKRIQAHGTPPKTIEEFVGRLASETTSVSIARMVSPPGWSESGQTPTFGEFTVVLRGTVMAETRGHSFEIRAGQAFMVDPGEWVRYSTPGSEGAEYIAVCLPAFSPASVQRDASPGVT